MSKREVWVLVAPESSLLAPEGTLLAASPDRDQLARLGDNLHRYIPETDLDALKKENAALLALLKWANHPDRDVYQSLFDGCICIGENDRETMRAVTAVELVSKLGIGGDT